MEENSIIEKYKLDNSIVKICALNYCQYDPDFVPDDILKSFIEGILPQFSDSDDPVLEDFAELYPYKDDGIPLMGKAFMFTGRTGSGKATAETYICGKSYYVIDQLSDLDFDIEYLPDETARFYKIPASDIMAAGSAGEICSRLEQVFSELLAVLDEVEGLVNISFGDVTAIMSKKKTAECFCRCISDIFSKSQTICIITCSFEGEASELKDKYKKDFILYEIESPDTEKRKQYFDQFIMKYTVNDPKVEPEKRRCTFELVPGSQGISEMTEGFTWGMLKELRNMILMYVKGEIVKDDQENKVLPYVKRKITEDDERIIVSEDVIRKLAGRIRKSVYSPKKKYISQPQIITHEIPQPVIVQKAAEPVQETKQEENTEVLKEKPAENEFKEPDTFDELFAIANDTFAAVIISKDQEKAKPETNEQTMEN